MILKETRRKRAIPMRQVGAPCPVPLADFADLLGVGRAADGVRIALELASLEGTDEMGAPLALRRAAAVGCESVSLNVRARAFYEYPSLAIPRELDDNPFG